MSTPIMPALPLSLAKGLKKAPVFNTIFHETAARRGNCSVSLQPYATWAFEFDLDAVQGNESAVSSVIAQFLGLFMVCNGRNGLWLFTDPQDHAVTSATGGMLNVTPGAAAPMSSVGDGFSTQFQLARSIGGLAWDIIQNLNGTPTLYVNGVANYDWGIDDTGIVSFNPSLYVPSPTDVLTWSGSFRYLCRFDEDTVNALRCFTTNSGTDLWNVDSVKFSSEFV